MQNDNSEQLKILNKVINTDKILTSDQIEQALTAVFAMLSNFKSTTEQLNSETQQIITDVLNKVEEYHAQCIQDVTKENATALSSIEQKIQDAQKLIEEAKSTIPKDGYTPVKGKDYFDGEDAKPEDVVPLVLEKIKLPKYEMFDLEDKGENIVNEINKLPINKDVYKIDAKHIKNLPNYNPRVGANSASHILIGQDILSGTQGSVLFAGAGGILSQDNTNFFWDNTNKWLGLGTSSPSAPLHVLSAIANAAIFQSTSASPNDVNIQFRRNNPVSYTWKMGMFTGATSVFQFQNNGGSTIMSLLDSGNVGIGGITAPKLKLEVAGTSAAESASATPNGGLMIGDGTASNSQSLTMGILNGAGNHAWIQSRNNSNTNVYALALNPSGGNVGIGTTAPASALTVTTASSSVPNIADIGGRLATEGSAALKLSFQIAAVTAQKTNMYGLNIAPTYQDNIGGIDVLNYAHIRTAPLTGSAGDITNVYGLYIDANTTGTNNYSAYFAQNVGIGTTTPGATLHVAGNSIIGNITAFTNTNGLNATTKKMEIGGVSAQTTDADFGTLALSTLQNGTANAVGAIMFVNQGTGAGEKRLAQITSLTDGAINSGNMVFATANAGTVSERMRIDKAGNVGIGTSSPFSRTEINNNVDNSAIDLNTDTSGLIISNDNATVNSYAALRLISRGADSNAGDGNYIASITRGNNISDLVFGAIGGFSGTQAEYMRIQQGGNVGIGMIPTKTLDITGTMGITGLITTTATGEVFRALTAGTGPQSMRFANAGADTYWGVEGVTAGGFFTGSLSYSTVIYATTPVQVILGGVAKTIVTSTGLGIGTTAPNSTCHVNGSFAKGYRAISALRTLDATDYLVDCTGTFTVTLPTAVGITGREYIISNASTGTITIATTSAQTINGLTTQTLTTQYQTLTVYSNGANWRIA